MTDDDRAKLDALLLRAESLKADTLGLGWVPAADSAASALGRALRHDARAQTSESPAAFTRQAEDALLDAVTFALTAYLIHLDTRSDS